MLWRRTFSQELEPSTINGSNWNKCIHYLYMRLCIFLVESKQISRHWAQLLPPPLFTKYNFFNINMKVVSALLRLVVSPLLLVAW